MWAASQMWCPAPFLQNPNSAKALLFPVSSQSNRYLITKVSLRPNEPSEESLLELQTASGAELQALSLTDSKTGVLPELIPEDADFGHKRRVTLARLVKGVYELEHRRLQGISFEKSPPARTWWESVNFDLVDEFTLDRVQQQPDKNIDLAVYRWNNNSSSSSSSTATRRTDSPTQTPPCRKVVIAIRGTLLSVEDGWHNFHGSLQRLHLTPRYQQILEVVQQAVEAHGSDEICITGHSLGAALGLLVARTFATEKGIKLESHLFNPIYAYTWIPTSEELLENESLWQTVRAVRCVTVAVLANVFIDDESRVKIASDYTQLRDWAPHIYINMGDPICRGYWEYFTNHERLARNGGIGAYFANLAAPFSGRGLLTTIVGSKPSHLIPSAILHVCEGEPPTWLGADPTDRSRYFSHNLGSWMAEDLPMRTREVKLSSW